MQYQKFQLHSLHQEFQLDRLLHNGEEDSKSKRRRKSCVQVATCSDEHFSIVTSSSTASSPIASNSLGRMSIEPSSFDATSTPQVRLKDGCLGGLLEKQRGDPSHQEGDSEDSNNPAAETWYFKEELPLAHGAGSSVNKLKKTQKRRGDITSKHRHTHPSQRKPSSP